ncbi:MAG: glycosyl transferase family 1 [Cyclobacteriaceae bacterium]|nr:MAG: glycosyl transferase family 1 [Cyclobacteriaceae bacterium]
MTIGFDAKRLFRNFTGLGNYSRFVVQALKEHFPQNQYYLFTPSIKLNPDTQPFLSAPYHVVAPGGIMKKLHPLWRSVGMSFSKGASGLDIYHGLSQELPYFLPEKVKKIVTVHDLIFYRYPQYYNPLDVLIYKKKLKSACARAHRIVAISRQTAQDLQAFLHIDPDKISVVYQGFHPQFSAKQSPSRLEEVRQLYNLPANYLLCVGTIEPRKNAGILVEALSRLSPPVRMPLVLVGRQTAYAGQVLKRAEELNVRHLVLIRDKVAFAHLPAIYQGAAVFLYPSVFEGFGIPVIEGIGSGVPVISSTGSCFAEAGGPDTMYVSPADAVAWAEAISTVLNNENLRQQMVRNSQQYINRFKPENIARELMNIYSELLNQ